MDYFNFPTKEQITQTEILRNLRKNTQNRLKIRKTEELKKNEKSVVVKKKKKNAQTTRYK